MPLLAFLSALICAVLAFFALWRDPRSLAHRVFAAGMMVLALQQVATVYAAWAILPQDVVRWRYLRALVTAFLPGAWLLFSLSFGRANYAEYLTKWKWIVVASFVLPLALVIGFSNAFFLADPFLEKTSTWFIRVGWSGWAFHILVLLAAVSVLINLEGTLREFKGTLRWKIKFMVLGIGSIFAVQVYTTSQVILFWGVNSALDAVESGALLVGSVLLIVSFVRSPAFSVDLYVSQKVLYNSLTAFAIGLYLLAVGGLGQLSAYAGGTHGLVLASFVVFILLLGLVIFSMADEFRQKLKRLVDRNFHRPRYDYRREWMRFTERTASVVEINEFCAAVVATVSETFGVASVSIFLLDEAEKRLTLSGSTVFSSSERRNVKLTEKTDAEFLRILAHGRLPIDFARDESHIVKDFQVSRQGFLSEGQLRYCAPLLASGKLIGLMTLSERIDKEPFSLEDMDLLKAVADQTAANLSNLSLSKELLQAKELEAFQSLSAFFVHDLKNLASTLSLTLTNLPFHFDNPEFRKDALRAIARSVETINSISGNMSLINSKLELRPTRVDINQLVTGLLAQLNGSIKASLAFNAAAVPAVSLDLEQMQKVLLNLVLNANEAAGPEGEIQVTTGRSNGWITLSIKDNGCGMTEDFIETSLFKPFRTSKKQGLGIGLFHSKKIVEAHHGRIEVQSEVGKGSKFTVMLPVGETRQQTEDR